MIRADDIYFHCGVCGRDLTEDGVEYVRRMGTELPVCSHCVDMLIDGLEEYQRDPWKDSGVSIHDFI